MRRRLEMAGYISRRVATAASDGGEPQAGGGSWVKPFPALVEFLTLPKWEDGAVRATGTILVFIEDGIWKGCLRDRDQSLVAFVAAPTPEGILAAADKGLRGNDLDWRAQRPWDGRKKK
jgi:hypothetical protein